MNDLDLCLEVVSRSRQPLRYVTDDVTWPWKVKLVTPIRLERNISKTTWARGFKFGMQLCMGNAERAHE